MTEYAPQQAGDPFARSRAYFGQMAGWLAGDEAAGLTHAELEEQSGGRGRELTRRLFQEHLGLRAAVKVTGRRGIQVWIPVAPGLSYEDTRSWVEQLSKTIGGVVPDLVSWKWDVRDRGGLARLDYTQNVSNKTLVAPYSPRAAPGAPVSAPIAWAGSRPARRPAMCCSRAGR